MTKPGFKSGTNHCFQESEGSMADEFINRNTASALIAGALLGAGVALLFAPQSGRRTRRDIRQFTEKAGKTVDTVRIELEHSIDSIIGDIEEKLQEGLAVGADWTDGKIVELRRALEAARRSISEEIAKIQPS
jgi:gas vesicle protein